MGSSSSRAAQPEPPPLERTLTSQAREAITEQMLRQRDLAAKAQEEARHYKQLSSEALDALDTAAEQLEDQKKLAAAAVAGGALVAGVIGAIAATIIARRSSSVLLAASASAASFAFRGCRYCGLLQLDPKTQSSTPLK